MIGVAIHPMYFNSRPRKEVDVTLSNVTNIFIIHFNSRPRKEVDLNDFLQNPEGVAISTHDLARRSTLFSDFISLSQSFQLTTSQGGRQRRNNMDNLTQIFQLTTSQGGRL